MEQIDGAASRGLWITGWEQNGLGSNCDGAARGAEWALALWTARKPILHVEPPPHGTKVQASASVLASSLASNSTCRLRSLCHRAYVCWRFSIRRGGRADECGGLENRLTQKPNSD